VGKASMVSGSPRDRTLWAVWRARRVRRFPPCRPYPLRGPNGVPARAHTLHASQAPPASPDLGHLERKECPAQHLLLRPSSSGCRSRNPRKTTVVSVGFGLILASSTIHGTHPRPSFFRSIVLPCFQGAPCGPRFPKGGFQARPHVYAPPLTSRLTFEPAVFIILARRFVVSHFPTGLTCLGPGTRTLSGPGFEGAPQRAASAKPRRNKAFCNVRVRYHQGLHVTIDRGIQNQTP